MTATDITIRLEKLEEDRRRLVSELKAVDEEINQLSQEQKDRRIQAAKAMIEEFNLTPTELFGQAMPLAPPDTPQRKQRVKYVVPRYINASGDTWIGLGTNPKWMITALEAGRKKEEFLNPKWLELYGPK